MNINLVLFIISWIIIPLIIDVFFNLYSIIHVLFKRKKDILSLEYYPYISVIIPVFNSSKTLNKCVTSILNQNYPLDKIEIFLIDNGSTDDSHKIFLDIQSKLNSKTRIWWLESNNGKSLALNKGLYLATGQYIFNIDSDGYLHNDALINIVTKFENDNSVSAITGTVLVNSDSIKETPHFFNKLLKKCETFEYAESFLVGRAFQSNTNSIFSMAGAFSAFRKDSIIKTQLYNQKTLGEDLHMTSQIRSFIKGKILLSTDSYMFLDSISDFNALYRQRQRWQIGQIESANLFNNKNNKKTFNIFRFTLFKDHTLVFSRMIWLFASIYLLNLAYDYKSFIVVNLILYGTYCLVSLFNFFTIKLLLKNCLSEIKYFNKNIFIILLMPFYRILTFIIRYIGILNAFKDTKHWHIKDLNTEFKEIKNYILRK